MQNFSQRLFRSVVPGILFILLTVGVLLDVLISERLEEEFDQLLVTKSQGLMALSEFEDEGFAIENYERGLPQFAAAVNAEYFQFLDEKGEVVLSSISTPALHILASNDVRPSRSYLDIELPDGRQGRLLRSRYLPRVDIDDGISNGQDLELDPVPLGRIGTPVPDSVPEMLVNGTIVDREPVILSIAISREPLDTLILQMHVLLLLSGLLTMAMITWLSRRQIQSTVKPLKAITHQVQALNPSELDQRISIEDPVEELDLMVQQMNELLSRVEEAFDRERRFSGDVAHELRTPLTELRTMVEVRERWPEDPALAKDFTADVGQATLRMQRTVESLLALSRSEGNTSTVESFNTLPDFLNEAVDSFRNRAAEREVALLVALDAPAIAVQGRDEWPLIVCNLLENAIGYSERGTTVFIALNVSHNPDELQLTMTNTVTELEEHDLPHIFERLWRKDSSRTSTLHSGLGLALVKACAERVGVSIDCELIGKELTMRLNAPVVEYLEEGALTEVSRTFQATM